MSASDDLERLLAAATPVASRLDALENDRTAPAMYHLEQLVEECRRLRRVVNFVKAKGPSGPSQPA